MPRGDGTGPMGMGPMTGRGAGYCAGYAVPGFANVRGNWGGGRGWGGGGRGWRNRFFATGVPGWQWAGMAGANAAYPVDPAEARSRNLEALTAQAGSLQNALNAINAQIETLRNQKEE